MQSCCLLSQGSRWLPYCKVHKPLSWTFDRQMTKWLFPHPKPSRSLDTFTTFRKTRRPTKHRIIYNPQNVQKLHVKIQYTTYWIICICKIRGYALVTQFSKTLSIHRTVNPSFQTSNFSCLLILSSVISSLLRLPLSQCCCL